MFTCGEKSRKRRYLLGHTPLSTADSHSMGVHWPRRGLIAWHGGS